MDFLNGREWMDGWYVIKDPTGFVYASWWVFSNADDKKKAET